MTIIFNLSGEKLFDAPEAENLRAAVLAAKAAGADLSGADLRGAYLRGADLSGADLGGADLSGADLSGAYLGGADLSGAYLSGADLRRADLRGAYLPGAELYGVYLRGASGVYSFGPIGEEKRLGYVVKHKTSVMIQLGCFWGTAHEAVVAIEKKYGPASLYAAQIELAVKILEG